MQQENFNFFLLDVVVVDVVVFVKGSLRHMSEEIKV